MMRAPFLPWVLLVLVAGSGCGSTVCDEAFDKAESCGLSNIELNDSGDACEEFAACQAGCVNEASCNDIVEVSQNVGAQNDLSACLFECGE
jgi:hypothetical protein